MRSIRPDKSLVTFVVRVTVGRDEVYRLKMDKKIDTNLPIQETFQRGDKVGDKRVMTLQ